MSSRDDTCVTKWQRVCASVEHATRDCGCGCSYLGGVIAIAGAQAGVTPVARAAGRGHEGMVRMLIEAKADPNFSDNVRVLA